MRYDLNNSYAQARRAISNGLGGDQVNSFVDFNKIMAPSKSGELRSPPHGENNFQKVEAQILRYS
jgi:hypothetical protein